MDAVALSEEQLHEEQQAVKIGGKALWVARIVWLLLFYLLFTTWLDGIPDTFRALKVICYDGVDCWSWAATTPLRLEAIQSYNISLQQYAISQVMLFVGASLLYWIVGLFLFWKRSNEPFSLMVSYMLISLGSGGPSFVLASALDDVDVPLLIELIGTLALLVQFLLIMLFLLTFPDGRFKPKWSKWLLTLIIWNYVVWLVPSDNPLNILNWPSLLAASHLLIVFGSPVLVQIYRYRRFHNSIEKQQFKWVIFSFGLTLLLTFFFDGIIRLIDTGGNTVQLLEGAFTSVLFVPLPIGLAFAILRYRLWDIDIIVNRTLVYGLLTTLLIVIYSLIVSSLGLLVQHEDNFVVSLVGAGVIAVIFQPLRTRIQRTINHWIFGQRDEPLAVMIELGKSLEMIASPEAALSHLVETTAKTLKLPYVAIQQNDQSELVSFGKSVAKPSYFPLIHQAKNIGMLLVSPRSPGEALNATDKLVLENVARQVSNLVHALRLTNDLQQSRQEILTTREEERRRLRRDLHDGLGPALATLTLQAEAASEWLSTNPAKSEDLLQEIIRGSQSILSEIRRIVYALRPPALDDLGLISAIQEQATRYTKKDLVILVEVPEQVPPLPAAVEVASYRIVQEALTNVARHSHARNCTISLRCNGYMDIEVKDDGIGIPAQQRSGVGLNSIHERATELGGSCIIKSKEGEGTHIIVSLPI